MRGVFLFKNRHQNPRFHGSLAAPPLGSLGPLLFATTPPHAFTNLPKCDSKTSSNNLRANDVWRMAYVEIE